MQGEGSGVECVLVTTTLMGSENSKAGNYRTTRFCFQVQQKTLRATESGRFHVLFTFFFRKTL